jgi:CRISPR-associated exonuclease Cas4
MKVDLIETDEGEIVVAEIKKSSRFVEAARLQVLFYLQRLQEQGIHVRGELRFPRERKRIPVVLDDVGRINLQEAVSGIQALLKELAPPPPRLIPYCRRCAYKEFCWGDYLGEENVV